MKRSVCLVLIICSLSGYTQNVGINTDGGAPDVSALLDVRSTNKGLLVPRMTQAQRIAITTPANGLLVYQTDGQQGFYYNNGSPGIPAWIANGAANNTWTIFGNSLLASGTLGTTSNNHIDLISNNLIRGRLSNLGEFFIGTINTTVPGDLMASVSNSTFPFAVNGYSSFNGAGVYGAIQAGTTQFAAVQGEYQSNSAGIFNTAGVKGVNQSSTAGTGFRTNLGTGPRAGVIGNTSATSGQYTFGVHGTMGSTDIRSGGLIGDDFGIALGTLAYYAANQVDYSVYGFGRAYEPGVAGGNANEPGAQVGNTEPNTHIGLGIYGGVMGGWIKGLVYGTHLQGDRYSLYVDGKAYTNQPMAELVANADGSRTANYGLVSQQPDVYAKGKAALENGRRYIAFSSSFLIMASLNDIAITVSPLASSGGLYIGKQDANGFWVYENNEGTSNVEFTWIAIAGRKGFEQINHAPELLVKDFDSRMNGVMHNENETTSQPQYLWWDGLAIRYDKPPAKQPDPNYQPVVRKQ